MSQERLAVAPASFARIEKELDELGYVVVPHGADLCVRLPLLCSVRLRHDGGRVRFIAKFGPFGRSSGLLVTSVVSTALVGVAAFTVGVPAAIAVGFLGVAALTLDACRFIVTEGALTRLQNLLDRREH
jgi:hypothetical protein